MNTYFKSTAFALSCLAASSAGAAVIFADDFDSYAAGVLNTQNGGTGFSAGWAVTNSNATVSTNSFGANTPTGYSLSTSANSFFLSPSATSTVTAARTLTTGIDTNPGVATTYYFSYLFARYDAANTASGEQFRLQFRNGSTEQFGVGLSSGELIEITNGTAFTGTATSGTARTIGSTNFTAAPKYLMVGKITVGAGVGADSVSISLFTSADSVSTEPGAWQFTRTGSITATTINAIAFSGGASAGPNSIGEVSVDNLYFGNSFADVTAVPEPSSFAAFAGLGMLGFAAGSRRRRQT